MEELKEFLLSHTYIKVVFLTENSWTIHRPTEKHEIKTREEIINPVLEKKDEVKKTNKKK